MNGEERFELHRRLENWARVYADRFKKECAPGFRLYRSPDTYHDGETPRAFDYRDAERVQAAWLQLGARDRILIGWWHILNANPHVLVRRVNRIGPTMITQRTLEHYIRCAENELQLHLVVPRKMRYSHSDNLVSA